MTLEIALVFAIVAGAVGLFVTEFLPLDLVALMVLSTLLLFGIVTPKRASPD